jgi:hypothetical protein
LRSQAEGAEERVEKITLNAAGAPVGTTKVEGL